MKLVMIACLSLLIGFVSQAQSKIEGRVTSIDGSPLQGTAVVVKDGKMATTTNPDGFFALKLSRLPVTLVFSYVGYNKKEYKVTAKDTLKPISIIMEPVKESLSDVVVTSAYGETAFSASTKSKSESPAALAKEKIISADGYAYKGIATAEKKSDKAYSRILTAGELSDFKKWKLWGDYNESEFSSHSDHWKMAFRKRYCVQVQNNKHKPVIGEKVFLLNDDTRDTIWQAVTDNTGKVELWSDADAAANEQTNYSIVCSGQWLNDPMLFEKGINKITLKRGCSVSNNVDIAFMVDATGSMGDEINYLQAELQDIIDKTASKYNNVNLRLGSVFYRDRGDDYVTRSFNFQTDATQCVNFIKKQSARGGGDFPEAVEEGMAAALDSIQWSTEARTKILFMVLDAPPHDAAIQKMKALIQKAAAKGIRIVPIACSGINKSTEYLLRCAALATNGSYVFLTDDSGVGNPHIKPTTDEFKVELLNELLQRLIGEMIYVPACNEVVKPEPIVKDTAASRVTVLIYPNPTQGKVTIESSVSIREVYLTDFTGKLLMKLESAKNKRRWQLYLSTYPSGTYLLKYFVEEKGWAAEKIILIH